MMTIRTNQTCGHFFSANDLADKTPPEERQAFSLDSSGHIVWMTVAAEDRDHRRPLRTGSVTLPAFVARSLLKALQSRSR